MSPVEEKGFGSDFPDEAGEGLMNPMVGSRSDYPDEVGENLMSPVDGLRSDSQMRMEGTS